MGMFLATIGALSTFYPEAKHVHDKNIRMLNVVRLLAKVPTIAAWSFRHSQGFPFVYPDNQLSFAGNFLAMMKRMSEPRYRPNPILERALDVLFILHADHEQNCSTSVMRRRAARWSIRTRRWRRLRRRSTVRCTVVPTRQSCACSPRSAASPTSRPSSRK
jgi:citrate synthase